MPNREERAYFDGLRVIDDYLPDEHMWRRKWVEEYYRDAPLTPEERHERRCAFKLYLNVVYIRPVPHAIPEFDRLKLHVAYRTFCNRLFEARDDQLTPSGVEELV